VPQLLSIDEEFRAIEMTIVRSPFLLDFADARLDEAADFSEDVLRQWEEDKGEFSVKDGQRLLAFSQHYRRSAFIYSILIQAIFPFLKRLGKTKSEIVSKRHNKDLSMLHLDPLVTTRRLTGWPLTSPSTISGTSATVTRP
jgi:hypothetical protein